MSDPKWFSPPVFVATESLGVTMKITNVQSAAEELLKWGRRGPEWRNAVAMCTASLEGKRPAFVARKAFEAAARESGMLR